MRRYFFLLLIYFPTLFSAEYDCIIIGSSPFSLFEALYQYHSGKSVLILEESEDCGGAWKSISICGVSNADLGCHQIGHDMNLKAFLEEYAGCVTVSLDQPNNTFDAIQGPNGWYFSRGCHELIGNLMRLISATDIEVLNGIRAENVLIDLLNEEAIIQTTSKDFSTYKLIVTPMSSLSVNCHCLSMESKKGKYYHLYMLIHDPTPFRFTYRKGCSKGLSRMMNLTHFVGLRDTDMQLIAMQTYNDQHFGSAEIFLDAMKKQNLIDRSAYILDTETYVYESGVFHQSLIHQLGNQKIVEILQTGHIQNLSRYIERWKETLHPFHLALTN